MMVDLLTQPGDHLGAASGRSHQPVANDRVAVAGKRPHPAKLTLAAAVAVQAPLLFLAARNAGDRFNPDAVAYIRIAEYYLDHLWNLAISGYWAPALSWLIATLIPAVGDPLVAARCVMAISAAAYLLGAARLYAALDLGTTTLPVAAALTALWTIGASVSVISPDLLLAAVLMLAMARALTPMEQETKRRAFVTGSLFGLAYLIKAVALPIGIVLLVSLGVLRRATGQGSPSAIGRRLVSALAGLLIVAAAWIAVISIRYQTFTISQSALLAHAIVGPTNPRHDPMLFHELVVPEPGRITAWEDPWRFPDDDWSAFASATNFVHLLSLIATNISRVAANLNSFDLLGLGLAGTTLIIFLAGPLAPSVWSARWTLAPAAVALLVWQYLPVYAADTRYYLACFPFLLAGSLELAAWIAARGLLASTFDRSVTHASVLVVVGVSFLVPIAMAVTRAVTQPSGVPGLALSRAIVAGLAHADIKVQGIASVGEDHDAGLYTAFLSRHPWFGNATRTGAAADLLHSGANVFIIEVGNPLGATLQHEPSLRAVPIEAPGIDASHVRVFATTAPDRDAETAHPSRPATQ